MELTDCSAHAPDKGLTCYARPDFVLTTPYPLPGVQELKKHACMAHLGGLTFNLMRETANTWATVVEVTRYEGA